jgi:hypothetical protein
MVTLKMLFKSDTNYGTLNLIMNANLELIDLKANALIEYCFEKYSNKAKLDE